MDCFIGVISWFSRQSNHRDSSNAVGPIFYIATTVFPLYLSWISVGFVIDFLLFFSFSDLAGNLLEGTLPSFWVSSEGSLELLWISFLSFFNNSSLSLSLWSSQFNLFIHFFVLLLGTFQAIILIVLSAIILRFPCLTLGGGRFSVVKFSSKQSYGLLSDWFLLLVFQRSIAMPL